MGLPLFEEYLGDDAGDRDAPDEKGELQATAISEGYEFKGRVASGYEQIDGTVIEDAKDRLGSLGHECVVERREEELKDERDAHEEGRHKAGATPMVHRP